MNTLLCVDFGSTFTKLRGFDQDSGELIASIQTATTVGTTILDGLHTGLRELQRLSGVDPEGWGTRLACSSAAGGLRMAAVGLVPELTLKAARQAALGAGAKIIASYAGALSCGELTELERLKPDILLLCGGTDGGNRAVLLENAGLLSSNSLCAPVIVAGNKSVAEEAASLLRQGGKRAVVAPNVMPELQVLEVAGAQAAIRELFLEKIILAKGFEGAAPFFHEPMMPTPRAVLLATEYLGRLMSEAAEHPVLVVDLGGATTDVHSAAAGTPSGPDMIAHGLPEPFLKRTVEGDIGMRYGATGILEAADEAALADSCGMTPDELQAYCAGLAASPETLPVDARTASVDTALAGAAVEAAVARHAGTMRVRYGPHGQVVIVEGKDLRPKGTVIGTGGFFVRGDNPLRALSRAAYDPAAPHSLRPVDPDLAIDRDYLLFAAGLIFYYRALCEKGAKRLAARLLDLG